MYVYNDVCIRAHYCSSVVQANFQVPGLTATFREGAPNTCHPRRMAGRNMATGFPRDSQGIPSEKPEKWRL